MASTGDDERARKARASRLRRQIAAVKSGSKRPPPVSPRDFIDEKMREPPPRPRTGRKKAR
jgi:hypothetical protein